MGTKHSKHKSEDGISDPSNNKCLESHTADDLTVVIQLKPTLLSAYHYGRTDPNCSMRTLHSAIKRLYHSLLPHNNLGNS